MAAASRAPLYGVGTTNGVPPPPPRAIAAVPTIVVRQPAEEKGSYLVREWTICSDEAIARTTFTLKDMVVDGDKRPLLWGAHSYVGRIFLPLGVVAQLFSDCACKQPHTTVVGNNEEVDFWDFDHRVMAFRFLATQPDLDRQARARALEESAYALPRKSPPLHAYVSPYDLPHARTQVRPPNGARK